MSQLKEPVLSVRIEQKSFGEAPIICNVTFNLDRNRFLVLLGPSGCGKTTLLRIIAGLDTDFAGQVELEAKPFTRPTSRVAMMFQDVRLLPWMTIGRNLQFAGAGLTSGRPPVELLNSVGLSPSVLNLYPRQLSGGMAKRVALARALATNPSVLLLDEPFSDLDPRAKYALYDLLVETVTSAARPVSAVMVTHDISEAVYLADEIIVLSGRRPATIASNVSVDLRRPRRRDDPEFIKLYANLMMSAISD